MNLKLKKISILIVGYISPSKIRKKTHDVTGFSLALL